MDRDDGVLANQICEGDNYGDAVSTLLFSIAVEVHRWEDGRERRRSDSSDSPPLTKVNEGDTNETKDKATKNRVNRPGDREETMRLDAISTRRHDLRSDDAICASTRLEVAAQH